MPTSTSTTRNLRRSATNAGRPPFPATVVLGIDPGTLVTGFGVVARRGSALRLVASGAITNPSGSSLPERLHTIHTRLLEVIAEHAPDQCAIESAFYGKNAQSALKLGHARGVCLLAAMQHGLTPAEYTPREVKKSVVGNGNASKDQVQYMVKALLGLDPSRMRSPSPCAISTGVLLPQRITATGERTSRHTPKR